jgi:hypothetical protein
LLLPGDNSVSKKAEAEAEVKLAPLTKPAVSLNAEAGEAVTDEQGEEEKDNDEGG